MKKLLILFFLLLIPHLASASVISLTTTISTDIMTEATTKIHVKLLNSGDEPAHNVQISLLSSSFSAKPIFVGVLSPNEPFDGDFNVTLTGEIIPGTYPVVVLTDYADANGYPFSSVSPSSIVYRTQTVSKISGIISELSLSGKESKKLILIIRNLDDTPHDVEVKLFLPRELKTVSDEKTMFIESKEEKKIDFEVSSFSALAGSSYVVLASLEYEDDLHYSSFGRGMVKIVEGGDLSVPNWLLIAIVIILLIVFILYQIKGKLRHG